MNDVHRSPKVLVAEDNRAMGNVLSFALEREGFDVTLARSGTEAIEVCETSTFDFVLTDHQMPGASGVDLCRHLRGQAKHAVVPILFCSAKGFELDALELREEFGVIDVALKPFSTSEIVNSVRAATTALAVE